MISCTEIASIQEKNGDLGYAEMKGKVPGGLGISFCVRWNIK